MNNTRSITRRSALAQGAAALGAAAVLPATIARASQDSDEAEAPAGRLLMLGGTAFLGPQIVRAALDAGWEVTLFNRGKTRPDLFPDLDLRKGDRNDGDYASLAEGEWDLVIDTSCYIPGHVTAAIEALDGRAGHYVVVSTISVYADDAGEDGVVDESGKLEKIENDKLGEFEVIRDVGKFGGRYYGALKALCESAAETALPGKVTVVRPGLIVGPEDSSDRFTYWPVRVAEGGKVLAPGAPDNHVQYVDVRDLGVFTFQVGARGTGKIYNAVGFEKPVTMAQMLESCRIEDENAPEAELVWVPEDFLVEQGVGYWMDLPLWLPAGHSTYTNALAREDGLTFRPLADTAAATLAWHRKERKKDHRWRAGIDREREAEVLEAWAQKSR